MRISDWSSDVCSSDLPIHDLVGAQNPVPHGNGALGDRVEQHQRRCFIARDSHSRSLTRVHHIVREIPARTAIHRDSHDRHPMARSEEHTSELQSLMRISYAVFCLKKKTKTYNIIKQTRV